jgi:hypothetical protein
MESGATQQHTFPLRNDGDAPLSVEFVSHTCKCTQVLLGGKNADPGVSISIPPHGDAEIMLEWAAKIPPGSFRHGATFTTNDPDNPRLELHVEGEIVGSLALEPSSLLFGSVHVGEPAKAELAVMSFLDADAQVLSHEVIGEQLEGHMEITTEPIPADKLPNPQAKAGVKLIAHYDPRDTLGQFAGSLRIETNLKDKEGKPRKFEVPVLGTVKGDISIFAKNGETNGIVRLPPVASAQGGSETLTINIRGDHAADAELTLDRVDPPELKAALGERKTMREGLVSVPLTLSIPKGTRPMARAGEDQGGEGEVVLGTNIPGAKQVRLRVLFTVLP